MSMKLHIVVGCWYIVVSRQYLVNKDVGINERGFWFLE